MKTKKIVKSTTNRGEFNKVYKWHLEHKGEIHCSRCPYHCNENQDHNWYGGFYDEKKNEYQIRYPNWKLISKRPKQWMKKPMVITEKVSTYPGTKRVYVEVKIST